MRKTVITCDICGAEIPTIGLHGRRICDKDICNTCYNKNPFDYIQLDEIYVIVVEFDGKKYNYISDVDAYEGIAVVDFNGRTWTLPVVDILDADEIPMDKLKTYKWIYGIIDPDTIPTIL